MLKIIYSALVCCLYFVAPAQAQSSPKELDKTLTQVSNKMCDCFSQSHKHSSDKELIKLLDKMLKKGATAGEAYVSSLPPAKQQKILEGIAEMDRMNESGEFENCFASEEENITKYLSGGGSEADLLPKLIEKFKKNKKCKLLYLFMAMAQQSE